MSDQTKNREVCVEMSFDPSDMLFLWVLIREIEHKYSTIHIIVGESLAVMIRYKIEMLREFFQLINTKMELGFVLNGRGSEKDFPATEEDELHINRLATEMEKEGCFGDRGHLILDYMRFMRNWNATGGDDIARHLIVLKPAREAFEAIHDSTFYLKNIDAIVYCHGVPTNSNINIVNRYFNTYKTMQIIEPVKYFGLESVDYELPISVSKSVAFSRLLKYTTQWNKNTERELTGKIESELGKRYISRTNVLKWVEVLNAIRGNDYRLISIGELACLHQLQLLCNSTDAVTTSLQRVKLLGAVDKFQFDLDCDSSVFGNCADKSEHTQKFLVDCIQMAVDKLFN